MEDTKIHIQTLSQELLGRLRKVIVGKDTVLMWTFAAILSGGHILLEDVPGVGKTTMAVAFSKALGMQYNRVQFTPDVLPSDITGYSVLDPATGKMRYQPGAILCNLFLADELNRATSRTQSALLEAMEEDQVTVDGKTYPLKHPFVVIATQNPTGAAGTQLLPDSQMDRFSLRLSLGYPNPKEEIAMVMGRLQEDPMKSLVPMLTAETVVELQKIVSATYVSKSVVQYIVKLINATRNDPRIARGASPRATLCVTDMAKAVAQLDGRDYVVPEDVQGAFLQCVPHRLLLTPGAESSGETARKILEDIVDLVRLPKLE